MADITVTVANVLRVDGTTGTGTAGATITAGQPLYADSTDSGKLKLADADAAASADSVGVALHGSLTGQPVKYQASGQITIGGTVVVGEVYCVSTTAGGVAPDADVIAGDYRTILGVGTSATVITLKLFTSGAQIP